MNSNLKSINQWSSSFEWLKNYIHLMRLDRPIGIYLCLCPALWSLSLASPLFPFKQVFLFVLGAVLMRGAGCTINDLVDRHIDKKVARTQIRPLAAGLISPFHAVIFLSLQLLGALYILFTFNKLTILLGFLIIVPIFLYPFFKRFTYWPQIFLGIIFNWGCLMGWTVIHNTLSFPALLLYISCIFWTIGYDTVYAFQDYQDDQKIGVKSAALKVGYTKGKIFIISCYLLFFLGLLLSAYLLNNIFFGLSLVPFSIIVFLNIKKLSLKDPQACSQFFRSNGKLGFLIWASILIPNFVSLWL